METYFYYFLLILGTTLLIISQMGINRFDNQWSYYSSSIASNYPSIKVLPTLFKTGLSPITALILQVIFTLCLFTLIAVVMCAIYSLTQRKYTLLISSVVIFFYAAVSFSVLPEELALLSVASYAEVYHGFLIFGSVWPPLLLMAVFIFLTLFLARWVRESFLRVSLIKHYVPYLIYTALVSLGLASNVLEYNQLGKTLGEFIVLKFYGVSGAGYSFLQHVYYSIVFLGFCYLYQISIHNFLKTNLHYELIRFSSYKKWFNKYLIKTAQSILILMIVLFLITVIFGSMKGYDFSFIVSIDQVALNHWQVVYHFIVNGYLQILNYCLILFIVSWLFKEAYYGLFALTFMMIIMVLTTNFNNLIPIGLNAFSVLDHTSVLTVSLTLIVYLILEYILIRYTIKKSEVL